MFSPVSHAAARVEREALLGLGEDGVLILDQERQAASSGRGFLGTSDIDLYVEVKGLSEADARALVEATHQVCPYSNATRGNVDVRLHTSVA